VIGSAPQRLSEGKTGQDNHSKSPSTQRLVRATAANHWVGRKPQTVSEMAAPSWIEHQRAPGSLLQPCRRPQARWGNQNPSLGRTAREGEWLGVLAAHSLIVPLWAYPNQHLIPDDAAGYIAAHQERDAPKLLLLREALSGAEHSPDTLSKLQVVGHSTYLRGTTWRNPTILEQVQTMPMTRYSSA